MITRRHFGSFVFAAFATTAIISAALGQADAPSEIRVGDRWTYDVRDEITGETRRTSTYTVIEVTAKELTARVNWKTRQRPRTVVYDPYWARIDDDLWKFAPHDGISLKPPLKAGDQWRTNHVARNMRSGLVLNTSGSAKVTGEETITTPAGTFRTIKIEIDEQQAQGVDSSRFVTINVQVWYAPEINRWARKKTVVRNEGRVRESFSEELTEYARKP